MLRTPLSLSVISVALLGYLPGCGGSATANVQADAGTGAALGYAVVDTNQTRCFDATSAIEPPAAGASLAGQDAQFAGNAPAYQDNGDGTITDLVTGLMWVKARGEKIAWQDAAAAAKKSRVGGYSDWRVPTIKELYSLIEYSGKNGRDPTSSAGYVPFIDTHYFDFSYGSGTSTTAGSGERIIDCQDWSSTRYVGTTMNHAKTVFGVNFADGRIKGYPEQSPATQNPTKMYVRFVRGNPAYGENHFVDNGDGTVSDEATGLMWARADSGRGMDWASALLWVEKQNAASYLGHDDWRLPDIKELQSILDYSRAPDATDAHARGPAIDPVFDISTITAPDGSTAYPYFWSSTSLLDGSTAIPALYASFGRALGYMQPPAGGDYMLLDVHGAGAVRSDPKSGDPAAYPHGHGPEGDVVRIDNYVRLVRGGAKPTTASSPGAAKDAGTAAGNACGGCQTDQVCCPAGARCAGTCVPDCRLAGKCPSGLTCDTSLGICTP